MTPDTTRIDHSDKYNDPRAKITRRGLLISFAVFLFAISGAYLSIIGRRTPVDKTTEFWGQKTITALQLGERFAITAVDNRDEKPVDLTAMPGLGLLRQAFLDDRNYEWESAGDAPFESRISQNESSETIRFRISDPRGKRFDTVELDLDLSSGWIGDSAGKRSVRMNEHIRPKLRNFLNTVIHAERKRYDFRE